MHKLLEIQLKKSLGSEWKTALSPELALFLELVDQSYTQYDEDHRLVEHILEVSSKELTEANRDIGKSHELLHSVTESINDSIFYKNLDFTYIGCNQHFEQFAGKSKEEIIGKNDFDLFEPTYANLFRKMDTLMLKTMKPRTNDEWVKHADGTDVLYQTTKAPLLNAQGELVGLVGISRDITKERHLEQEVKSQQAMLIQQSRLAAMGEMIGNIAHQWRQPLNALGLIVQDIEEAYEFGELNKEYIQTTSSKAMDQINYMSQTIEDFRNFFNPEKTKKLFSLHSSIMSTIDILSASMKKNGIQYTISIPENLQIYGYPNEFSQVIFNLLNNAKDALMGKEVTTPLLRIEAHQDNNKIQILISDNGGGIPEAVFPKIFDPYFTTKEEGKGSGIGLYMSKMIIQEQMQGTLKAHNIQDGVCFTILLDASHHEPEEISDDL
ncbi:MAG TPA: PAS domain-containing sensor histidine kinase [Sulfuricurvum sp.]|nr:PAS domain-containing sensor histidine kinase [Sulfuricurvum sp.]